MAVHESAGKELARGAGLFVGHVIALAVGVVLMIAGVAMGVTMVMLPIGIPLGLAGLAVFLWGLFGWSQGKSRPLRIHGPVDDFRSVSAGLEPAEATVETSAGSTRSEFPWTNTRPPVICS